MLDCDLSLAKLSSVERVPVAMMLGLPAEYRIRFLFHVIDGDVSELKVSRADPEPLTRIPDRHDACCPFKIACGVS